MSNIRLIEELKADVKRLQKAHYNEMVDHEETKTRLAAAEAENKRLREALTPSAETKTAYMGEFSVPFPLLDDEGNDVIQRINVPWVIIKEIMAAIRARAALEGRDD